ncbi:MAG: DUF4129 domain-containing protein [Pseudolysinimonas sp.]|uniref:DUF4129 domain-containing protein n=1 Tax=Pseudolysinimonas sp. TaxID=2680009 RepID=UPI003266B406
MIAGLPIDVPVDPGDDQAREWLQEELGNNSYVPPAQPDWWDLPSVPEGPGQIANTGGTVGVVIGVVILVAILGVAFWIFGLPRLRRRSKVTGDLFGEDDDRSAVSIRTAAEKAAAAGDYTSAVVEAFRAMARDLAERGIVQTFPGTTARDFGRRAGAVFPTTTERLGVAAAVFDGVRYLGRVGTADEWERMSSLATELRGARKPMARAVDAFDDVEPSPAPRSR